MLDTCPSKFVLILYNKGVFCINFLPANWKLFVVELFIMIFMNVSNLLLGVAIEVSIHFFF